MEPTTIQPTGTPEPTNPALTVVADSSLDTPFVEAKTTETAVEVAAVANPQESTVITPSPAKPTLEERFLGVRDTAEAKAARAWPDVAFKIFGAVSGSAGILGALVTAGFASIGEAQTAAMFGTGTAAAAAISYLCFRYFDQRSARA